MICDVENHLLSMANLLNAIQMEQSPAAILVGAGVEKLCTFANAMGVSIMVTS